ncbi:dual specificity phosphatase, partial [Pavlovales sp. CCMP2436]
VYIGNRRAASTRKILSKHGVKAVVNCQGVDSSNFFEGSKGVRYFRMDVQQWATAVREEDNVHGEGAAGYFTPCWEWVDKSLEKGDSVLIHCYAGAHRAGTVGVAYLMHAAGLRLSEAMRVAQRQRPIVNP